MLQCYFLNNPPSYIYKKELREREFTEKAGGYVDLSAMSMCVYVRKAR